MKKNNVMLVMILVSLQLTLILISAQDYPTIKPYVNDFGGFLNAQQIELLDSRCQAIKDNTTYEIAIVTVNTTNGQDRLDYANRIGEQNGVGKVDVSNGLVLLWTQDNEKGIAIAVGRGAESIFNDAKVSRYAREARPLFDQGKYYDGFNLMLDDIQTELNSSSNPVTPNIPSFDLTTWVVIIGAIILVIYILAKIFNSDDMVGSGSGGFSGGSFSSSSGGSFGGGFSGGSFGGGGGRG